MAKKSFGRGEQPSEREEQVEKAATLEVAKVHYDAILMALNDTDLPTEAMRKKLAKNRLYYGWKVMLERSFLTLMNLKLNPAW